MTRLIFVGIVGITIGCGSINPGPGVAATKPSLTALAPDKDGVYSVPKGTTVGDLGIMVPGTYTARKSTGDPLDHLDSLNADRRKAFTGYLILDDEDPSWQLTFQFEGGKFNQGTYQELNKDVDPARPKVALKNGATIAEAVKVFPSKSDVRFYSPIVLPRDSNTLSHFSGHLGRLSAYPTAFFEIKDGKVESTGANLGDGKTIIRSGDVQIIQKP